jgi:pilus assembly protein Flp/PilA
MSQTPTTMPKTLKRFLVDESGATAIEYGLIAAGISLAIITIVPTIGDKIKLAFTTIETTMK